MKYLLLLLTAILFTNCSSVPKSYLDNNAICHFDAPIFKITKNDLHLNIDKVFPNRKHGNKIIEETPLYISRCTFWSDGKFAKDITDKKLGICKWLRYRKDGTIFSSHFEYLKGSVKVLEERYYDENGAVTKVIDYEEGYTICWAEALNIVKNRTRLELLTYKRPTFSLRRTSNRDDKNSRRTWGVSVKKHINAEYHEIYVIDGVTGKFIEKEKMMISGC